MIARHSKGLLLLSYPIYFELLSNVVAGIIGTFWVSKLGSDAVAAVVIATNLENVLLGIILLASAGTTVLISKYQGGKDLASVKGIVRAGLLLYAILTPLVALLGFVFREEIAALFFQGNETVPIQLAASFLTISFPGVVFFFGQTMVDAIFKGNGNTKIPFQMALLSNFLILILDPLFIYGWAGVPALGVPGSALATVIARTLTLLVALFLLLRSSQFKTIVQADSQHKLIDKAKEILRIGLPFSGDFLARMVSSMLVISLIGTFGVAALAGYGIGTKILVIVTMFFYAVRQALSIQTAHASGAGDTSKITALGYSTIVLSLGVAAVTGILMYILTPFLIGLYSQAEDVIREGVVYLHYMSGYLLPLGVAVSLGGVFLGAGKSRIVFYVTLLGTFLSLGSAYALSSIPALGLNGVWVAQWIGALFQAVVLLIAFRKDEKTQIHAEGGVQA